MKGFIMEEMSYLHKKSLLKTIYELNSFIVRRKYSNLASDVKLIVTSPAGEEVEIYTVVAAEQYKKHLEEVLSIERVYAL